MLKSLLFCVLLGLASAQKNAYGGRPGASSNRRSPVPSGAYRPPVIGGPSSVNRYQGNTARTGDADAITQSFHSDVRENGFEYALETSNGIHAQQSGDAAGNVQGDFSYISPEGVPVQMSYTADENGYHPTGDLLPTPPPIPPAILKALEYIRTHPPYDENQQRSSSPVRSNKVSSFGRNTGRRN